MEDAIGHVAAAVVYRWILAVSVLPYLLSYKKPHFEVKIKFEARPLFPE